jgi:hypothetical protein
MAKSKKKNVEPEETFEEFHQEPEREAQDEYSAVGEAFTASVEDRDYDDGARFAEAPQIGNMEPLKETWADDPENIRWKLGELVVRRGQSRKKDAVVFKCCGPSTEYQTYFFKATESRDPIIMTSYDVVKAPKSAGWEEYIGCPYKKWKREQEKKKK